MSSGLVRACISNIVEQSPSGYERSTKLKEVGGKVLKRSGDKVEVFDDFCFKLVEFMKQDITTTCKRLKCSISKHSKLWSKFHKHRTDSKGHLIVLWKQKIKDLELESNGDAKEDPLLMQAVLKSVFEESMAEYFRSQEINGASSTSNQSTVCELTSDEMNALRYASGFVPHSLLKKFEKKKDRKYVEFVACLGEMSVAGEGSNILEYTQKWIELVNRGGLFPLNDDAFSFFVQVERCVRCNLPRHVLSTLSDDRDSFKQNVHDKVVADEEVQFHWTLLSYEIRDPEEAHEEIVKLWITVRGYSLTASWMEVYKRNERKTVDKSTGLRKGLSGSS